MSRFITDPSPISAPAALIESAGHYIQDDAAEELSAIVIQFMQSNPI